MRTIFSSIFLVFIFAYAHSQSLHNVIITEIFADPTPSRGLPEKEFIELYNNTSETIELNDYNLSYSSTNVDFPSYLFPPQSYLIVCRRGNGELYTPYGPVLELSKFSLLNGGTTLKLTNSNGALEHVVTYNSTWYSPGQDQGYSLEMIDLQYPCVGRDNWKSSVAEVGATPGLINSVNGENPDLEGPQLVSTLITPDTVTLFFSEEIINLADAYTFSIDPSIPNTSLEVVNGSSLQFTLGVSIDPNTLYTFTIDGIADCSGNIASNNVYIISNIPPPEEGDLKITEVLFDPWPDGDDFVEIKNNTDQPLNLRGLKSWRLNNDREIDDLETLVDIDLILEPDSVIVFTENKEYLIKQYPYTVANNIVEVLDLSAMPNTEGEILIGLSTSEAIDSFFYDEDMHNINIDDTEGISLEINNNGVFSTGYFWKYATPGLIPLKKEEGPVVELVNEIITPDNDFEKDELEILMEGLGNSSSVTVKIFDRNGRLIDTPYNNIYIGSQALLSWNPSQLQLPVGYYFVSLFITDTNFVNTFKLPFVVGKSE